MLPFNPSFRNLLSRFMPQVPGDKLDKYESYLSLWHQLKQEKNILDEKKEDDKRIIGIIQSQIDQAAKKTRDILKPAKHKFEALQRLYSARRRLALSQGKFLQIPTSLGNFAKFVWQILKFRWLQIKTFWRLIGPRLSNALKAPTVPKLALGAVLICLLSVGVWTFYNNSKLGPDVTDIRQSHKMTFPEPGIAKADIENKIIFLMPSKSLVTLPSDASQLSKHVRVETETLPVVTIVHQDTIERVVTTFTTITFMPSFVGIETEKPTIKTSWNSTEDSIKVELTTITSVNVPIIAESPQVDTVITNIVKRTLDATTGTATAVFRTRAIIKTPKKLLTKK